MRRAATHVLSGAISAICPVIAAGFLTQTRRLGRNGNLHNSTSLDVTRPGAIITAKYSTAYGLGNIVNYQTGNNSEALWAKQERVARPWLWQRLFQQLISSHLRRIRAQSATAFVSASVSGATLSVTFFGTGYVPLRVRPEGARLRSVLRLLHACRCCLCSAEKKLHRGTSRPAL